MNEFLKELNIAELLEHDAFTVWKKMEVGTRVTLKGENGKIVVCLKSGEIIGVLPKEETDFIIKLSNTNWPIDQMFECYICRKDDNAGTYDQKIHVLIQIRNIKEENSDQIRKIVEKANEQKGIPQEEKKANG